MKVCACSKICRPRQDVGRVVEALSRREWIKSFVIGSASAALGSWKSPLLAEIEPTSPEDNILKISVSEYPVLQADYGSMRFSLFGEAVPNGIVTITRAPGDVFYAMSARCTHEGGIVDAYDPEISAMVCQQHLSMYDIQGRVTHKYVPTQGDLTTYPVTFEGGVVRVTIPGLAVKVISVRTANPYTADSQRFELRFNAVSGQPYRVCHTLDFASSPEPVPFASSAFLPPNLSVYYPPTTGPRSLWVDAETSRGFYVIQLVVNPY